MARKADPGDLDYLRTMTTTFLVGLQKRTKRSVSELTEHLANITTVLVERATEEENSHG